MSAPIRSEDGIDDPLSYAPRWARQSPPVVPELPAFTQPPATAPGITHASPATPGATTAPAAAHRITHAPPMAPAIADAPPMAPGIGGPNLELPPPRLPPFEGDIAIKELRRRLALDPDIVPQPLIRIQREPLVPWIGRFSFVLILAAIVAFGVTLLTLPHAARQQASGMAGVVTPLLDGLSRVGTSTQPRRLIVESQRAFANEPLPLGVSLNEKKDARLAPRLDPSRPPPVIQTLDPEEIAILVKRGEEFLKNGDIAAARLFLRRAASAGNAQAALALGATFDPAFLAEQGVLGFAPDLVQARAWYEKAGELGSSEASRRIERLANRGR